MNTMQGTFERVFDKKEITKASLRGLISNVGIKKVKFDQLYRLYLGNKNCASYLIIRDKVVNWDRDSPLRASFEIIIL